MSARRGHSHRRGNAAYTVLVLLGLFGFASLAIDVGRARAVKAQLQVACDAAAHAAVGVLVASDPDTYDSAVDMAIAVAALNEVDGESLQIDATAVEIGRWEEDEFVVTDDPEQVNGVRVTHELDDIATVFGLAAFGIDTMSAGARAVVMAPPGGPASEGTCYLPIAIPDCWFDGVIADEQVMDMTFVFNPATLDDIGWARTDGSVNTAAVTAIFDDFNDGDDDCSGGTAVVGEQVNLGNGVAVPNLNAAYAALQRSTDTWDESLLGIRPPPASNATVVNGNTVAYNNSQLTAAEYGRHSGMSAEELAAASPGKILQGPMIVFDGGASYTCPTDGSEPGGSFNGSATIVGFAWAVIYDVTETGGAASKKTIRAMVDLSVVHEWGDEADSTAIDAEVEVTQGPPRVVQ